MSDDALTALRREIDRIDAEVHARLMERGEIIDRLIAAKGTTLSGSAFRPEREAAMMRVLAGRHRGRLPADAVEGIWRIIISTFTHVQAPFCVHAPTGGDPAAVQDSVRFHFGFTVPFRPVAGAAEAVAAVAASRGDLGLVAWEGAPGAWWRALEPEAAPKVIARLPFVERPGHPAGLPMLLMSRRLSDEGLGAVVLRSASGLRAPDGIAEAVAAQGGAVLAAAEGSALVAAPHELPVDALADALGASRIALVGSHPAAFRPELTPPATP